MVLGVFQIKSTARNIHGPLVPIPGVNALSRDAPIVPTSGLAYLTGHALLYLSIPAVFSDTSTACQQRGSRGSNPATQARCLMSRVSDTLRLDVSLVSISVEFVFKKPALHTRKDTTCLRGP